MKMKNKKYSVELTDKNVIVNDIRIKSLLTYEAQGKSNKGIKLNPKRVELSKSLSEIRTAKKQAIKEGSWSLYLFCNTYRQFTGVSYEFLLKKLKNDSQLRELLRTSGIFKIKEDPNPIYIPLSKRYKVMVGKEKELIRFVVKYLLKDVQRKQILKKFSTSL